MWYRIRISGEASEAASEQTTFLEKMSQWNVGHTADLSERGVPTTTDEAVIYSASDADDTVWHLNDVALGMYRVVGGMRPVEAQVDEVPPEWRRVLSLRTAVFREQT